MRGTMWLFELARLHKRGRVELRQALRGVHREVGARGFVVGYR
jgi:hypothetical protein